MTPLRPAVSCLPRSVPHFFPSGFRSAALNYLTPLPRATSFQQTRNFSQTQFNSKGDAVNKARTLGLGALFGGICLVSLFAHAKETEAPAIVDISSSKIADDKALSRYFELLDRYPKLKREGELNDHAKGTYEIIYEPAAIQAVKKEVYERLYNRSRQQGLSHEQADELATNYSRPGVVCEDQFWLWIRDAVISPQGYRHTYNRIVAKSDLERIGGAAALPIILDNGTKKIVLQLAFRHATNSWEMEMPRGGSKPNETPSDTAKREILEETGYETANLVALGVMTPDSGLTASIVPIFTGQVTLEKATQHDKTEAIKAKYAFTLAQVMEGLKCGYMEVEINNKLTQVPLRDPFLAYALLMAQHDGLL